MDEQDSFGTWLRRLRRARDLTQEGLAREVGCAAVTIQKIETGALRPSRQIAERLAARLGVPLDERAAFVAAARGVPPPPTVAAAPPVDHASREPLPGHLPAPATDLIGRAPLLAAIRAGLGAGARLLTLVGPPGIGKTRLALAAAWERGGDFADGARFVPLAAVSDPARVADAVAHTLGLEFIGGRTSREILRDYLRSRELLLVLDNVEQVVEAAPLAADLLAAAPGLRILVTSRVALHLSGERELPVPPLDTGGREWQVAADGPVGSSEPHVAPLPAVELFVRRAQAVRPDFAITAASLRDVATICVRLDGLPLAIELAAARSRIFPPAALLARLERRLALLTGGPRDWAPRQQTLRAAIDWSYRLLSPEAQALFARLSVFVGGWTLPAATAVAGGDGGPDELDTLERLTTLVDQSLVQCAAGPGGEPRFSLLETLREYALERLDERGEIEETRRRHAEHYLALAEAGSAALWGSDQVVWLDRLAAEHDNLRAALGWSLEQPGDSTLAPRLAGALGWFWHFRGHWLEGRRWLARALAGWEEAGSPRGAGGGPEVALARARYAAAGLAWAERDYGASQRHADAAVALARASGDHHALAHALGVGGLLALYRGDADPEPAFSESLAAFRRAEDEAGVGLALLRLGLAAWARGDLGTAQTRLDQALAKFRAIGAVWGTATTLASLGDVARARDDWGRVAQLYAEALQGYRRLRSSWYVASSLAALAGALGMLGSDEQAARLHGASAVLFESIGMDLHDLDRAQYAAGLEAARSRLGEAGYEAAYAAGRSASPEELADAVPLRAGECARGSHEER